MDEKRKQLAQAVIESMTDGMSLRKACQEVGVKASTFLDWVDKSTELAEQYTRARAMLLEHMAEDLMQIADEPVPSTQSGSYDTGAVQKQRLQVDTRKWLLSKLAPKKYGEKMQLSGDAENPIAIQKIERVIVDK
jgi:hypothetical protein